MADPTLVQAIQSLAADLVMLDSKSPQSEWSQLRQKAASITDQLKADGSFMAADCAERIAALCGMLEAHVLGDPGYCFSLLGEAVSVLQLVEEDNEIGQNAFRQVVAEIDGFMRDYSGGAGEEDDDDEEEDPGIEMEYVDEIQKRIDGLEQMLFEINPPESDEDTVRTVFREIHTLKGEAGIVGFKQLSEFWHGVESSIEDARHGNLILTRPVVENLLILTQYGSQILKGTCQDDTCIFRADAAQQALVEAVANGGVAAEAQPAAPVDVDIEEEEDDDFFAGADSTPTAPAADVDDDEDDDFFAEAVAKYGDDEPAPPAPVDEGISEPVAEPEAPAVKATPEPKKAPPPPANEEAAPAVDLSAEGDASTGEHHLQTVSIQVGRLDSLMDLVGEVSMLGAQLAHHPEISAIKNVSAMLQDLARFSRGLQDLSATLRMTSVAPLFQRTQRAALEAARQVQKRINVKVEGRTTQVDRSVIDQLSAAFIHLVRNSADHGIESLEERRAAGKPAQGTISLRAYRSGGDVVLEISDDGRGLNLERIRQKAVSLGQVGPDEQLSESDLARLVFSSGLSTAQSVTGLSGRGVGMSVVSESIKALRGRVDIDTTPGQGSCFRMRFPAALSAVEGLLVRLGENILVFPVSVVSETFRVRPDQINTIEGRGTVVTIRGVVVPVIDLGEQLGLMADSSDVTTDGVLVLIEEDEHLAALWVDEVLETRQTVIRQLEGALNNIPDISGAVPLSDRRVALMVDTRRLIESCNVASGNALREAGKRQASAGNRVETVDIGSNTVGMIDFTVRRPAAGGGVEDQIFAINAFKAREFVPSEYLTPVPHAPLGFAGMLLLRDETIPVVALNVLLGFIDDAHRESDWERIIVVCEFSGKTVGFLVSHVNRVSYVSWSDILPPPESGGMFKMEYVVGTILLNRLRDESEQDSLLSDNGDNEQVAFVLDFERIVQQIFQLYGDVGENLEGVQQRKKNNRILLVEDSPLIRRETANALRKAGIDVIEAEDGEMAMAIIQKLYGQAKSEGVSIFTYIDLVLSDIEMPKCDGYSLTISLKSHPELRVLPVLLHSSLTNDTIIARAKEVEADGFVPKCDPKALSQELRRYL